MCKSTRRILLFIFFLFLLCIYQFSYAEEENTLIYRKPAWLCTDEELKKAEVVKEYVYDDYKSYKDIDGVSEERAKFTCPIVENELYEYAILPDDTVTILTFKRPTENVVIPDSIDGYIVTGLGVNYPAARSGGKPSPANDLGFSGLGGYNPFNRTREKISSIEFPATLNMIGYGTIALKKGQVLALPESVKILYWNAGFDLRSNGTLKLPQQMDYIGPDISLYGIKKLVLPEQIGHISEYAFNDTDISEVTLPQYIGEIEKGTFLNCKSLTKVNFQEGLTDIADRMFEGCIKLQTISLPQSVKRIGEEAFSRCSKLTKVTMPGPSIEEIGTRAFSECVSLTKLTLPDGLKSIGDEAFYSCQKLTSILVPDSVLSISNHAFAGCSSKLVLNVVEDSYAENWAIEHGISVKTTERKNYKWLRDYLKKKLKVTLKKADSFEEYMVYLKDAGISFDDVDSLKQFAKSMESEEQLKEALEEMKNN